MEKLNMAKDAYKEGLEKLYGKNQDMIDYLMKQAEKIVIMHDFIVPIEKQGIKKSFCFGYSSIGQGPEYSVAIASANNARKSEECFKRENMKEYAEAIERIKKADAVTIAETYEKPTNIRAITLFKWWEILQAINMPCAFLNDIKGTEITINGRKAYVLTDAERAELVREYEKAMQAHEKRVNAYLKRYGISKIKVWTYWIDE